MRKHLTIFFLLINSVCFAQWKNIPDSQYVSSSEINNAVQNGYFTLVSPFNSNLKLVKKDSAAYWIAINSNNATLLPKPINQYVTKRDLTPVIPAGCAGSVDFLQNSNYGNGVYMNVGTSSDTVKLDFEAVGIASPGNRINIYYGGALLQSFLSGMSADTTVNLNYSYNSAKGSILFIKYLNGSLSPSHYTITSTCPASGNKIIYWGYTNTGNDTAQADLQYSVAVSTGGSGGFAMQSNYVSDGVHYITVKVPLDYPIMTKWYNSNLSHGSIPDQTFQAPVIFGNYRYYFTRGLQSFDFTQGLSFVN